MNTVSRNHLFLKITTTPHFNYCSAKTNKTHCNYIFAAVAKESRSPKIYTKTGRCRSTFPKLVFCFFPPSQCAVTLTTCPRGAPGCHGSPRLPPQKRFLARGAAAAREGEGAGHLLLLRDLQWPRREIHFAEDKETAAEPARKNRLGAKQTCTSFFPCPLKET